ncbi:group I intron-associated PD-(D/E)XK endonuclease [Paracoccus jeotgali]|uniref:PD(D/E)XK endonuclease domain-containing protein n=1 Tax=Paracoccus jeotgali TaxID=2065379 RepID=A0A2K9MEC3_9RHOB|nr:group I intron-associated PD-(D/E)XK endonuclease [Paracoccus jeotgali]AUM73998.1 hypothetical protein CYR75_06710 [Paracoccus jeotgali]
MGRQLTLPGSHLWDGGPDTGHDPLRAYPEVEPNVISKRAREIGLSGELLVMSKLIRIGFTVLQPPDHLHHDLMMVWQNRLLRVQVKATTRPYKGAYRFTMSKGYRNNPLGTRPYERCDYDLAALVILPEECVFFTAERRERHCLPVSVIAQLRAHPTHSLFEALSELRQTPS